MTVSAFIKHLSTACSMDGINPDNTKIRFELVSSDGDNTSLYPEDLDASDGEVTVYFN
jgi:hypothetical protein